MTGARSTFVTNNTAKMFLRQPLSAGPVKPAMRGGFTARYAHGATRGLESFTRGNLSAEAWNSVQSRWIAVPHFARRQWRARVFLTLARRLAG